MNKFMNLLFKGALVACFLFNANAIVMAGDKDFGAQTPSVNEFVEALAPKKELRFRGIKRTPSATEPALPTGVSMQLQFEFDSHRLTPASKQSLDNLSKALKSDELLDYRFAIAGYTDASGSAQYNQGLSERRADSVRNYLVIQHGIDSSRLETAGLGERDLLVQSNPYSEKNRRVAIRNIGQ